MRSSDDAASAASLSRFQAAILAWDFFTLRRAGGPLAHVPQRFASFAEYVAVFEPLILEECCAQVLRGGEEEAVQAARAAFSCRASRHSPLMYLGVASYS